MGLFDRPARVRVAVYLEAAQRAEIQRIANAEDATASQVHRAALAYGLPELRKARRLLMAYCALSTLQNGRHPGVPAADGELQVEAAAP